MLSEKLDIVDDIVTKRILYFKTKWEVGALLVIGIFDDIKLLFLER